MAFAIAHLQRSAHARLYRRRILLAAGRALGLDIRIFNAGANGELAAAFAAFSGWRPEALLALAAGDPLGALKRIVRFPTCCREQMQRTIL
jgi:hypothetical protein